MIKIPENKVAVKVSIKLKNGEKFYDKDIIENPLVVPGYISFWVKEDLRVYSLEEVEYYELTFGLRAENVLVI